MLISRSRCAVFGHFSVFFSLLLTFNTGEFNLHVMLSKYRNRSIFDGTIEGKIHELRHQRTREASLPMNERLTDSCES